MKVWIDGRVVDGSEARVPVTDHGLLYGDGIFEGIRLAGGRVFRLDSHLARLRHSGRAIGLELPGGIAGVREIVLATARAWGRPDGYVRLLVTRGDGAMGVDPTRCPSPRVICIACEIELFPAQLLATGVSMVTVSVRRPGPDVLDPRVKSLNYLNSVLAKREARLRGADEALILNSVGNVAEAAVANVFAFRRGKLLTPPATDGALEGVTRGCVMELAAGLGIPAEERSLTRMDLLSADEVFLSGTGARIVAVRSLDGAEIGVRAPGPVTEKLAAAFAEVARSDGPIYLD
ncbi:MAG: branched-chain-amino-acid transaminase [Deltaproteobacteria bacterium]|nr:branched-chain-amino-acid transaminase [Deltaproteobacteria bacterium]